MTTERLKEQWRRASLKYSRLNRNKRNEYNRTYKMKLVEQRRCTSCSTPLLPEENRTCMNCRGNIKKELAYATNSKRLNQQNV